MFADSMIDPQVVSFLLWTPFKEILGFFSIFSRIHLKGFVWIGNFF